MMPSHHSPLEIRHLRTLLVLAETGSLTRTGEVLCLTQAAISSQLRQLESHYGLELYARKSNPPRFSDAGMALLTLARQILPMLESTEKQLASLVADQQMLTISASSPCSFQWLTPATQLFQQRHSARKLDFLMGWPVDPVGMLKEEKADIVFAEELVTTEARKDFAFRFELVAVLPRGHYLLERKTLSASDFAKEPLITFALPDSRIDILQQVLFPAGIRPDIRKEADISKIIQLTALGYGIACLPAFGIQDALAAGLIACRRIGNDGLFCDLFAYHLPTSDRATLANDFIACVSQAAKQLPSLTVGQA